VEEQIVVLFAKALLF